MTSTFMVADFGGQESARLATQTRFKQGPYLARGSLLASVSLMLLLGSGAKAKEATTDVLRLGSPSWTDTEDLRDVCKGFPSRVRPGEWPIIAFAKYETPANAERAFRGSEAEREQAAARASDHRARLLRRKFHLQTRYKVLTHEIAPLMISKSDDGKPSMTLLLVDLPMGMYGVIPPRAGDLGCSNFFGSLAFLTKEGTLKRCSNEDASLVESNGGLVYAEEMLDFSSLTIMTTTGDEDGKALVSPDHAEKHVVNLKLTLLRMDRPETQGFYKLSGLRASGFNCTLIRNEAGGLFNGPDEAPNYFVVKKGKGSDDPDMQEVAMVDVVACEIIRIDGDKRKIVFEWSADGPQENILGQPRR